MKGLFLLFWFILLTPAHARPQVVLVLADHLTLADVTRPDLPNLTQMRRGGQIALMSPGLAHGKDPAGNVYATLGAGDSVSVGDVSQGLLGRTLRAAGVKTALVGDAPGFFRPAPDFTFPAPSSAADLWAATQTALHDADFVVVQASGDLHRLDRLIGLVMHWLSNERTVMLVSPVPPIDSSGGWSHLTVFGETMRGRSSGLTSNTTHTPGLVAARDIAPAVLHRLNVSAPVQMTGTFVVSTGGRVLIADDPELEKLDRQTHLNQVVLAPLFVTLGVAGAVIVFGGLALFLTGRLADDARVRRAVLFGLRALSAWPLALLFAPLLNSPTAAVYLSVITFLTLALACLPSPYVILSLTAVVLVADGLTGTSLVSQSVLSGYALSGIRFYGIGNEYMGVLLAGSLTLAAWKKAGKWGAALWFCLATFALSFPAFGAKAGGAVTAAATFWLAWRRLSGRSIRLRDAVLSVAVGFALVFLWVGVGHLLGTRRTHLETAAEALADGRFGYIVGVIGRKAAMAVRIGLHPAALLGLAGLVGIILASRRWLRRPVAQYREKCPRFAAVWDAGLCGCLVSMVFNDSGIIAAALLLSCLILTLLHGVFQEISCESLPLMSGMSESASPSATA